MESSDDLMRAWNHARAALRVETGRSIVRVVGVKSIDEGELVGTGTFLRLRGNPYLLTAEHVAAREPRYQMLGFASGERSRPQRFLHPFSAITAPSDLAVARVEDSQMNESAAIDSGRFANSTNALRGDLLFLNGFPGTKSRFSGIAGGLVSAPIGIATVEGLCTKVWFNPRIHFALDYDPAEWVDESGKKVDPPDPHGMSGSLIWRSKLAKPSAWSFASAEIVGVVTQWVPDQKVLVATRAEVVTAFLLHALREESAYYAWCERGRPEGDALTDWVWAEQAVTSL